MEGGRVWMGAGRKYGGEEGGRCDETTKRRADEDAGGGWERGEKDARKGGRHGGRLCQTRMLQRRGNGGEVTGRGARQDAAPPEGETEGQGEAGGRFGFEGGEGVWYN